MCWKLWRKEAKFYLPVQIITIKVGLLCAIVFAWLGIRFHESESQEKRKYYSN
jgi:hypothetical protein